MKTLTPGKFVEEVLNSKKPVVVNYWSDDCVSCKHLISEMDQLKVKYKDQIKFARLNLSGELTYNTESSRLALNQGVRRLPAVAIYKFGEKKELLSGSGLDINQVKNAMEKYV